MKKIIILLFLFFLIINLICYHIYNVTNNKQLLISGIGDSVVLINDSYNTSFTNKDYRIIDLLNIIKYNEEITLDDKSISIHQILNNSDIIIVGIGMNDIYHKLNDNTKEIYTYLNNMLNNYDEILKEINKYNYRGIYILGYYNITNKHNDLFTYVNYKLKQLANKNNGTFIDLNGKICSYHLKKEGEYYLNKAGYNEIYKLIVENYKKN